jgi:hypothetical protein
MTATVCITIVMHAWRALCWCGVPAVSPTWRLAYAALAFATDVATFLWFYHAKHFMVFNLSGEEYDYAKFDNRVRCCCCCRRCW